jgi:hypothetical protein
MYTPSLTVDNVIDALGAFIDPFVSPAPVVRAQVNRVPMPEGDCVVLTELFQGDLSIPHETYQPDDDTAEIRNSTSIDIQIDFYGSEAGEWCNVVKNVFRSQWGWDHFPAGIKPLFTSEGMQWPLTTGEQQYESRWTLTAHLQYNPFVTVPQQFADVLTVSVHEPSDTLI